MLVLALGAALGLAFVLGVSDAPNATGALLGSGATTTGRALRFSFACHLLGGLAGGSAVAGTLGALVTIGSDDGVVMIAAACLAATTVTLGAARRGIPTSASFGLVGGLAGAALALGGPDAPHWGGFSGLRPVGTVGVAVGMLCSPVAGLVLAAVVRRILGRALRRAPRRARRPLRAGTWAAAAVVAFAGGANDTQKAMGLMTGALVADGAARGTGIPVPVRVGAALALATGTVVGGRRVIRAVARRFYRPRPLDGFAAQLVGAVVVAGAGPVGAPVSTSSVAAAAVAGAGGAIRPRHVRWARLGSVFVIWVATLPVCGLLAAALALGLRALA